MGEKPDRSITASDLPFPTGGNTTADTLANLINGFGVCEALELWRRLDADTIDGLIHVTNELRRDPDERVEEYLKRCVDEHYKDNDTQKLLDLGISPEQFENVVRI